MYSNGFVAAVIVGLVALVLPAIWIAWWKVADLGERVGGAAHVEPRRASPHGA